MTNDNENKDLNLELAKTIINNVGKEFSLNKKMRIGLAYDMGLSAEDAATIANSTASYAHNAVSSIKTDAASKKKFQELRDALPDWYRGLKRSQLPLLAVAESKGLEQYIQDPSLIVRHPALARQLRIAAGVVEPDQKPIQVQINLAVLQGQQEQALQGLVEEPITIEIEDETHE